MMDNILGLQKQIRSIVAHVSVFVIYAVTLSIINIAGFLRKIIKLFPFIRPYGSIRILLTGTFYNEGWLRSHLVPLSKTVSIDKIYCVVDRPWFELDKVEYISPPFWMRKVLGRSASRICMVFFIAMKKRPDYLMGYHIMPNALACLLVASLIGAQAIYQMTGGPIQIIGGGPGSENVLLRLLGRKSNLLEAITFRVVSYFDLIVVRGNSALKFTSDHNLGKKRLIVTGGIDTELFKPDSSRAIYDLVCVSRLISYKGIEYLLEVMGELLKIRPGRRLAIVGDGLERPVFEKQAIDLGIENNVVFQGKRTDVVEALRNAKVFVLTSPSEGMSIAMLEAMATGVPAAVTNVGELSDTIEEGVTGILLSGNNPARTAYKISTLLDNEEELKRMSCNARQLILERHSIKSIACTWDEYFNGRYHNYSGLSTN